jgi:hypothetical protein
VVLDLRDISTFTDFFVICSAASEPQIKAIAGEIEVQLKQNHDTRPWYYFVPFRVPQIAWTSAEVRPMVDPSSERS